MRSLNERLAEAEELICQPSFRQNRGLGNEVGYYIFAYPPQDELKVREWTAYMSRTCTPESRGFQIAVFDLYDIIIDILQEKGYLEKCFEMEERYGLDRVVRAVSSSLRVADSSSLIIRHIREHMPDDAVLFLTGIGKCFPLLRSHTILNNMHQVIDSVPVVLFYPGQYNGQELILFGEIKDDNYYRAFRLVE